MAEKDANPNLDESVEVESLLNVIQDHMVTTNKIVSENVVEMVNVNVEAECSRNSEINIFNQLALMMEMMSGMKNEIKSETKSEINVVNNKLDK